ncbi:NDP-sugar epimerase, includes UDP-GlcNAc-inverting 4,6-dehydratase FlaA1 and capsular polysaccharide biosynthesis protein EpsC [Mameliella alba]|uniref:nucleoside-diphosphate sugar epimerase/dehydratase n=1 Tax=Mameliella alba TaxID=561184 RepID=UPI00088EB25F|nr:nucleoside-diphosphate sugar epimerase/dehydratase [Mameliella alba]OWV47828.1 polysaccharide biosynthesis protein [Mameliella alba]PTR39785.1 FlaA1/EpsC-like NDP-sugar epimerase [Mameliella alba]GGF61513.1 nucleotide sugar epimerase [Mameliella alba]SDD12363.1 NDP-sugar epimerase, includes UDP-GlcNAc-inverting 4,6-dehydratase FlaA1 and capsular polysaccharide biosynthesis protein EpsC [Mameliella alba]
MFYKIVTALSRAQKQALFILMDAIVVPLAMFAALVLAATVTPDSTTVSALLPLVLILNVTAVGLGWWLGLTRITLNAYEMRGVIRTATYAGLLAALGLALNAAMGTGLPLGAFVIFGLLLLVMSATWRIALRQFTLHVYRHGKDRMRVLIYGAGQTGQQLVAALRHDEAILPVAFIDDNPTLQSLMVSGLRVHAPSSLKKLVLDKDIDRVVLAMPSISQPAIARIAHKLRHIGCEVHALPSFAAMVGEGEIRKQVSPVSIQDLLGRSRLESELPGVSHVYSGRRILVSGAGGSIGSELCRQLIACKPACVVLVDHSELALYNIDKELRDIGDGLHIVPVLASVLDEQLMRDVLIEHDIDVVLHAAAYKHLPLVEKNVMAGLRNNVLGTKVLAEASRAAGVDRFILVSTDKAVRPTNVMGASKRLAELVIQDLAARTPGTRFSMVRFGNVLGSSGSVIPLFEEQIARGGPVTLTDPQVTRYFMTISEAARLVLLAGSFARGGDVFVLDMGDPVPIRKLARQMIEGAGFSVRDNDNPDGDIEIKITGLRPGEKLHEELLISPDMLTTPHTKILRAQESFLSEFEMATALKDLRLAIEAYDESAARAVILRWVEQAELDEAAQSV